jgi:hypothetical protein
LKGRLASHHQCSLHTGILIFSYRFVLVGASCIEQEYIIFKFQCLHKTSKPSLKLWHHVFVFLVSRFR